MEGPGAILANTVPLSIVKFIVTQFACPCCKPVGWPHLHLWMEARVDGAVPLSFPGKERARCVKIGTRRFAETPDVLKSAQRQHTVVPVLDLEIGGGEFITMAGPCSVETESQLMATANHVRRAGARILRGGAFKPRSSPYAFQGLGLEGLKMLARARQETGLAIVTEVMSEDDVPMVAEYADILQIGSRNMENFCSAGSRGAVGPADAAEARA